MARSAVSPSFIEAMKTLISFPAEGLGKISTRLLVPFSSVNSSSSVADRPATVESCHCALYQPSCAPAYWADPVRFSMWMILAVCHLFLSLDQVASTACCVHCALHH